MTQGFEGHKTRLSSTGCKAGYAASSEEWIKRYKRVRLSINDIFCRLAQTLWARLYHSLRIARYRPNLSTTASVIPKVCFTRQSRYDDIKCHQLSLRVQKLYFCLQLTTWVNYKNNAIIMQVFFHFFLYKRGLTNSRPQAPKQLQMSHRSLIRLV